MKLIPNSLQAYLLRQHTGPFLFSFLTVMFLLLMQFLINHIDKLVGKGIPLMVIIELILTNLAYMVVLAMPMAVLVATVMSYGKFAELNEYTAIRATGVNPLRLISPILVAATLLTVFLVWFSNFVLPDANHKARSLFIDIRIKKPGFDLKPNVFYDGINGYVFLVKGMDAETDSLYDVTLFQEKTAGRKKAIIKAERGHLSSETREIITLMLYNGTITRYVRQHGTVGTITEVTDFKRYRISFDLSSMEFSKSNPENRRKSDRTMSARAMLALTDTLKREVREEIAKHHTISSRLLPEESNDSLSSSVLESPHSVNIQPDSNAINHQQEYTVAEINLPSRATSLAVGDTFKKPDLNQNSVVSKVESTMLSVQEDGDNLKWASFVALKYLSNEEYKTILRTSSSALRGVKSNYMNLKSTLKWKKMRIARYLVEVHKKFSIPVACIIFVLIGAPLGLIARNGHLGFSAVVSAILLTFYWIGIIQGEKMADRLFISPVTGMWAANTVLLVIGLGLIVYVAAPIDFRTWWRRNAQ